MIKTLVLTAAIVASGAGMAMAQSSMPPSSGNTNGGVTNPPGSQGGTPAAQSKQKYASPAAPSSGAQQEK